MSAVDNPPAFPQTGNTTWGMLPEVGMTLRDWFAGQAMFEGLNWINQNQSGGYAEAAAVAYEYADAMLAERSKS